MTQDRMPRLSAEEIIEDWRKGRISAHLRDVMLKSEGYDVRPTGSRRKREEVSK